MALETALTIMPCCAPAAPNPTNDSFNKAKKMLEREINFDHRVTFYCDAGFDEHKNIDLPAGFLQNWHVCAVVHG